MSKLFGSIALAVGLFGFSPRAAAVEYVKVCSLYGEGFFYVPGSDVCFNPLTGETRVVTEGGIWKSVAPSTPGQWVANPEAGCAGGKLVHVATISESTLAYTDFRRYASALPSEVDLASGEFIANVLLTGGLSVTTASVSWNTVDANDDGNADTDGEGNTIYDCAHAVVSSTTTLANARLCVALQDSTAPGDRGGPKLAVLGCVDARPLGEQAATFSFTPARSDAPADFDPPAYFVAREDGSTEHWGQPTLPACGESATVTQSIDGTLSVNVCVRNVADSGACDPVSATCSGAAATPAVCVAGGTMFTIAVNGPAGTKYAVCSVVPPGFAGNAGNEFRCEGAGTSGTPTLYTSAEVADQFGDGFCGGSGQVE